MAAPERAWLALGDSYSSGEGIPGTVPETDDRGRDCRRAPGGKTSATAWSAGAYESVGPSRQFSKLAFVACTGAITDDVGAQLLEASRTSDRWDLVTFSFGGNNVGFGDVLRGCLDLNGGWDKFDLSPGCDVSEERLRARVDMLTGRKPIDSGEYDGGTGLPQLFDQVASKVKPGGDVIVAGYPQLAEEVARWYRWRRRILPGCEGIRARDVGMLRSVTGYLNEQTGLAVRAADRTARAQGVRFHFVDISRDPYEFSEDPTARHALCAKTPWLNGATIGLTSGDWRLERSFHPHQVGHTNTARVVADYVRENVKFGDRPDLGADDDRLTASGIGPLKLGMSESQARTAAGRLTVDDSGPFCDKWSVDGLNGVDLVAVRDGKGLRSIALNRSREHGAGGVENGDSLNTLKQEFGNQLQQVKTPSELTLTLYRVYSADRKTALQFTIDKSANTVQRQEAGFPGDFYYPDGNELCA